MILKTEVYTRFMQGVYREYTGKYRVDICSGVIAESLAIQVETSVLELYRNYVPNPDLTRFGKRCSVASHSGCVALSQYKRSDAKRRTNAPNQNSKFLIKRGV